MVEKVVATEAALNVIETLKAKFGPLMFFQSGGCCDGSSPMCHPEGEFIVGPSDLLLGEIGGCPFHITASQYEYWQHTQLIIDVTAGTGNGFSLEGPEGWTFLTRSRLFTDEEWASLQADAVTPGRA
ncbi:MAG: DUF779 domain-containing protein [Rhodocyclaceae bacterium]|nr:MAG: DUF779 domain-containing protein [Rhodocyclaceae bacterium]